MEILAPVYVDDVNGITKNWIDRLAHVCHRPEFAGKCAFLVATVANALFEAIHQRKYARPSFYALMVFKIQQWSWQRAVRGDTLDYQYWKNQGWFEAGRTFYIPHATNPVTLALARCVGGIITRFVAE